MRIYFDTEFTTMDALAECELISAGFVAEDGREWYAELTDFRTSECSAFVHERVLPQLGAPGTLRLTSDEIGPRLAEWLATFGEPIDLVTDYAGDWYLLNDYARFSFKALPNQVRGQVWQRLEHPLVVPALIEAEAGFWSTHPGRQHHALYDARRLKMLAERQAELMRTVTASERSPVSG